MVVETISEQRSTWTRWNAYAETERALRPFRFPSPQAREEMTEAVVGRVTSNDHSIRPRSCDFVGW